MRKELSDRGLNFPLHFYLSDEWFTPDGQASMAVPFYLAHPRLERLEKAQMLAVEGGEHEWCMRILRHEAGHVIDNAFKLRLREQRRRLFGSSKKPYPEFYDPRPYSKSFVMHLDPWYAQSHPDEDFAETFAVWLTPESNWKARYAGWRAIRKLDYMDSLMQSLVGRKPLLNHTEEVDPLRRLHRSLRYHYKKKRRHHGLDHPHFYDRDLRKLFSDSPEHAGNMTAAQFLGPRVASSAAWSPTGPAFTSTPSTKCSKTSSSAAGSCGCGSPRLKIRRCRNSRCSSPSRS